MAVGERKSAPTLDLLGVGPQKTATTWLDAALRGHPRLCLPEPVKETFFLDRNFAKGWPWYWSHFEHCPRDSRLGEIAPSVFHAPECVQRLHAHNPECRIVVSLRDPAERSFSLWLHHRRKGRVGADFLEAVDRMPVILDSSRYSNHLPHWIEAFGREQVLILLQEEIASTPTDVLERVCRFLEVEPLEEWPDSVNEREYSASLTAHPRLARVVSKSSHWLRRLGLYWVIEGARRLGIASVYRSGGEPPDMDDELRSRLVEIFEDDISYIESLTGRALESWRRV